MSDSEMNELEVKKMQYSPIRFLSTKTFREADLNAILNAEKLDCFVQKALGGELPLYWFSLPLKKPKFS